MNYNQLKQAIIDILTKINLPFNENVVNLIAETACQESACGKYIKQLNNGPAKGIFQCEPATAKDIMKNYVAYKPAIRSKLNEIYIHYLTLEDNLMYNLAYSVAICRIHYLRVAESVPDTVEGRAVYWKKYYNTSLGKGTVEEYIKNVNKYKEL